VLSAKALLRLEESYKSNDVPVVNTV